MRVQCSLVISDDDVYDGIQSLKEQRLFNEFVSQLVTKYFQDENFRSAFEAEPDEITVNDINCNDEYYNIRERVATMDIMFQDAENLINNAAATFEECMGQVENVRSAMHKKDNKSDTTTEQVPLIEAKRTIYTEEEDGDSDMLDIGLIAKQLEQVSTKVDSVMRDIAQLKQKGYIKTSNEQDVEEATEGVSEESTPDEDFSMEIPEETSENVDNEPATEDTLTFLEDDTTETEEEVQLGEARSDMDDLLSSMF